jgi:hypothetical protein
VRDYETMDLQSEKRKRVAIAVAQVLGQVREAVGMHMWAEKGGEARVGQRSTGPWVGSNRSAPSLLSRSKPTSRSLYSTRPAARVLARLVKWHEDAQGR